MSAGLRTGNRVTMSPSTRTKHSNRGTSAVAPALRPGLIARINAGRMAARRLHSPKALRDARQRCAPFTQGEQWRLRGGPKLAAARARQPECGQTPLCFGSAPKTGSDRTAERSTPERAAGVCDIRSPMSSWNEARTYLNSGSRRVLGHAGHQASLAWASVITNGPTSHWQKRACGRAHGLEPPGRDRIVVFGEAHLRRSPCSLHGIATNRTHLSPS